MIGCFILPAITSMLIQIIWSRAYLKAKMMYYFMYYFQILIYFIWFIAGPSFQNGQTLEQFFEPLYHYMLKSIWLEGKRNWCMDHLVHTLVVEFIPDLKIYYKWQELGMYGGDLAKQHCQQILRCTPETPLTQIQKIDDLHFEVQSLNLNKFYNINLVTTTCSCNDFPCIWLCKHIMAVVSVVMAL